MREQDIVFNWLNVDANLNKLPVLKVDIGVHQFITSNCAAFVIGDVTVYQIIDRYYKLIHQK